eukprot:superscaffoldBa00002231_g13606
MTLSLQPAYSSTAVTHHTSSPTAELAHLQGSHTKAHSPCRARLSVLCLRRAERYLGSPHNLWSSHTLFITASGLELHHSLFYRQ